MATVIGTCGHQLENVEGNMIRLKVEGFTKAVSYHTVCNKCFKIWSKWKEVIHNDKEEKRWLRV